MSVTCYPNMPDKDYYAHPAMSQSKLKAWAKSVKPKGRALEVGTAVHTAVLEGKEAFQHRYGTPTERYQGEEPDLRTADGALRKQEWEKGNPGKVFLKPSEQKSALATARALIGGTLTGKAIRTFKAREVAYIGTLEGIATTMKGKMDGISERYLYDVKRTHCRDVREFISLLIDPLWYHMQAALYVDLHYAASGHELPFRFLCVSTQTHETWMYEVPWTLIVAGRVQYQALMAVYDRIGWVPDFKWLSNNPAANAAYNTILDEMNKEQEQ